MKWNWPHSSPPAGGINVIVNGKPASQFSAKDERALRLARRRAAVQGAIMSADEATRAHVTKLRLLFGLLATVVTILVGVLALAGGGMWFSDEADRRLVYPIELLVLAGLGFLLFRRYRTLLEQWDARLGERLAAMPPAGAPVMVDDDGLTLGPRLFIWPSLRLATMELNRITNRNGTIFLIDRLLLESVTENPVLDVNVIRGGRAIVDNAYRRLRKAGVG